MIENESDVSNLLKKIFRLNSMLLKLKDKSKEQRAKNRYNYNHWISQLENTINSIEKEIFEFDQKNGRKGDWMPLMYYTRFWPEDPRPEDFDIELIAHSLSLINRFNGHVPKPYSVAQHSVLVSDLLPDHLKLLGLLHDATEAFVGDVIRPIKKIVGDIFIPMEDKIMSVIAEKYGIKDIFDNQEYIEELKKADDTALATEIRDVTGGKFGVTRLKYCPVKRKIKPWRSLYAKNTFLKRFYELCPTHQPKNVNSSPTSVEDILLPEVLLQNP